MHVRRAPEGGLMPVIIKLARSVTVCVALSLSIFSIGGCSKHAAEKNPPAQAARAPAVDVAGGENAPVVPQPAQGVSRTKPTTPPGGPAHAALAADDRLFGNATVLGNLAIYPVTSKSQVDAGPLVSLDDALAKGDAEIKEN